MIHILTHLLIIIRVGSVANNTPIFHFCFQVLSECKAIMIMLCGLSLTMKLKVRSVMSQTVRMDYYQPMSHS